MKTMQRAGARPAQPWAVWRSLGARLVLLAGLVSVGVAAAVGVTRYGVSGSGPGWLDVLVNALVPALLSAGAVLGVLHHQVLRRLRGVVVDIRDMAERTFPQTRHWPGWAADSGDDVDLVSQVARFTSGQVASLVGQLHEANAHLREQLVEQGKHLRTMSLLEEVVVELDPQLGITQASDGWARVLGGGMVPGMVVLLGGDPGIGKSTLLLQSMVTLAKTTSALYVSGEESAGQIALRAQRLGLEHANLSVLTEIQLEQIVAQLEILKPQVLVIDSIQTLYTTELSAAPGSVSQVRECASQLRRELLA